MDKNAYPPPQNQAYPPANYGAPQQGNFAPPPNQGVPPPPYAGQPGQVGHRPLPRGQPYNPYGERPIDITCPNCGSAVTTRVSSEFGTGAWLAGIAIACMGFICGCCLIPCMMDAFKVYTHTCPNCNSFLGKYGAPASLANNRL